MTDHRHLDPAALAAALPPEWAGDAARALSALQEALTPEGEGPCPACAGASALCNHGPVLLDRLASLATTFAETLREAGETDKTDLTEVEQRDRATAPTQHSPAPTTVRIEVSD